MCMTRAGRNQNEKLLTDWLWFCGWLFMTGTRLSIIMAAFLTWPPCTCECGDGTDMGGDGRPAGGEYPLYTPP